MASVKVAWVGRLTGPKGDIAWAVMTQIAPRFPQVQFTIIGGPVTEKFRANIPANVELTGFVSDVAERMKQHQLVIGSGRVALEAMRARVPLIAVGESCYLGAINDQTITRAKATNFGDCELPSPIDYEQLARDIALFLDQPGAFATTEYVRYLQEYDEDFVFQKTMKVYEEANLDGYLRRFVEMPVLMYHRVVAKPLTNSKFNVYVTAEEMDFQLGSLISRGFTPVTFAELQQGVHVPKPVILTFDDGYLDNYEVLLPLLKKHRAKAVIYALGDRSLRENAWDVVKGEPAAPLMTDAQLRECHASGLVEIGSHGMTHRRLPDLTVQQARDEITAAKASLEAVLDAPVVSFAYPYGAYGDREVDYVRDAGYRFGIGTVNGPLSLWRDYFRIRRITIFPGTRPLEFWKKTCGYYLRYCKFKGKDFK